MPQGLVGRRLAREALAKLADRRVDEALAQADAALSESPDDSEVYAAVGIVLTQSGAHDKATNKFEAGLLLDQRSYRCRAGLAGIYGSRGDVQRANKESFRALIDWREQNPLPEEISCDTVILLAGLGSGWLELGSSGEVQMNSGHNNFGTIGVGPAPGILLWTHELGANRKLCREAKTVVNTMSDPDQLCEPLTLAAEELWDAPVINHPIAVLRSRRDELSFAISGSPKAVVPRTVRLSKGELLSSRYPSLRFPLLARPVGSHGGHGLVCVNTETELQSVFKEMSTGECYLTEAFDCRNPDRLYRKARVYCVGGELVPEHMLTSNHWNVHSSTARPFTNANPQLVQDELRFLERFPGEHEAIVPLMKKLHKHLGLDCFMADLGLLADGHVVLFEAGAAAKIIEEDELPWEGEHLRPYTSRLRDAVRRLIFGGSTAAPRNPPCGGSEL